MVIDENTCIIILELLKCAKGKDEERVVQKFKEKNFEKLLRLVEMRVEYSDMIGEGMEILEEEDYPINEIYLDGYICKPTVFRKTPLGREIADVLLAVNRPYKKSDYIPCLCWGRNARFADSLDIGDHLQIKGRIQSREYYKRISETETESRTAYEVSASSLKLLEE